MLLDSDEKIGLNYENIRNCRSSWREIVLIIFVIILLFERLHRSLGKSLSEFKKGQREGSITETNSKIIEEDSENTLDNDASDK